MLHCQHLTSRGFVWHSPNIFFCLPWLRSRTESFHVSNFCCFPSLRVLKNLVLSLSDRLVFVTILATTCFPSALCSRYHSKTWGFQCYPLSTFSLYTLHLFVIVWLLIYTKYPMLLHSLTVLYYLCLLWNEPVSIPRLLFSNPFFQYYTSCSVPYIFVRV